MIVMMMVLRNHYWYQAKMVLQFQVFYHLTSKVCYKWNIFKACTVGIKIYVCLIEIPAFKKLFITKFYVNQSAPRTTVHFIELSALKHVRIKKKRFHRTTIKDINYWDKHRCNKCTTLIQYNITPFSLISMLKHVQTWIQHWNRGERGISDSSHNFRPWL